MLLWHPGAVKIDCGDCKKYLYNLETGERRTFKAGPKREDRPRPRGPMEALQCSECPKKSPENADACRLSDRNWKTLELFRSIRVAGTTEAMKQDPILMENLAVIGHLWSEWERHQAAVEVANQLIQILPVMRVR